jgi:hypothetical protein
MNRSQEPGKILAQRFGAAPKQGNEREIMRKQAALILLLVLFNGLQAQPGVEMFRLYDNGADRDEKFEDLYRRTDGGYFVCGMSNYRAWAMRLEENGDPVWSAMPGGNHLWSVIEADNGDAVMGGDLGGFSAIRYRDNGEVVWQRTYVAGGCSAVIELKAGNFALCGSSNHRGYITLIDPGGEPIWARSYGDYQINSLYAMRETEDGILAVGYTTAGGWALKIDFEGEPIWSRSYEGNDDIWCLSIISTTDGGFGVAGFTTRQWPNGNDYDSFCITKINAQGEIAYQRLYPEGAPSRYDGYSIAKLGDGGFILVGKRISAWRESPWTDYPIALRLNSDGDSLWMNDFRQGVERQPQGSHNNVLKSVIVQPNNRIVACGEFYNADNHGRGCDALLMRFDQDLSAPLIVLREPQETDLTVLVGDSIDFKVRAVTQLQREIEYTWFCRSDTVGNDTAVTIHFDSLGIDTVVCRVSVAGMSVEAKWYVTVKDFLIRSHTPDSLNLALRRGSRQNFEIVAASIGDEPVFYNWNLMDLNSQEGHDISDASAAVVEFRVASDYQLEAVAYRDSLNDAVTWNIAVRSCVLDFRPEQQTLTVPLDTTVTFGIIPFDPADTLRYLWLVDGDSVGKDSSVSIKFEAWDGQDAHPTRQVMAIVSDSSDADTIVWNVNVVRPNSAANPVFQLSAFSFQLSPNPFNARSTIQFSLPGPERALLTVHDLTGREVATLADRRFATGNQIVNFDAENLAAGIYLIRLQAGGRSMVKKAVVLK